MPLETHTSADGSTFLVGVDEELEDLMERAKVNGPQRLTFRGSPEAAKRLLAYALERPKIRNPAAFALDRLRAEQADPQAQRVGAIVDDLPADLDADEIARGLAFARRVGAPAAVIAALERDLARARAAA